MSANQYALVYTGAKVNHVRQPGGAVKRPIRFDKTDPQRFGGLPFAEVSEVEARFLSKHYPTLYRWEDAPKSAAVEIADLKIRLERVEVALRNQGILKAPKVAEAPAAPEAPKAPVPKAAKAPAAEPPAPAAPAAPEAPKAPVPPAPAG